MVAVRPYGTWPSPLAAADLAAAQVRFGDLALAEGAAWWVESRPAEDGRAVLVRADRAGGVRDVLAAPWSVRTAVHEYGGGAFAVAGGRVVFSHHGDGRLWRRDPDGALAPLVPPDARRWADLAIDVRRGRIVAVCEDHRAGGAAPENTLVTIDLAGRPPVATIARGHDFYAGPTLSPDGTALAWIAWRHPNMPWDGTELWVARIGADGAIGDARRVAGGPDESILQPGWSPDGVLHCVSDRGGWWTLHRCEAGGLLPCLDLRADMGQPPWALGVTTWAFAGRDRIACAWAVEGVWRLGVLDRRTGVLAPFDLPYTDVTHVHADERRVVCRAAGPTAPVAIVAVDLATGLATELRRAGDLALDGAAIARPEPMRVPTTGGAVAHAFHYRPTSVTSAAPAGARPPLVVRSHGGPTGATTAALDPAVQFWTTRGFAVLDVNYRGSTGYGRAYRRALDGAWGVADVDDVCAAATHAVAEGAADPRRLAIRGSSAGGYTVLCALAFRDVFQAGASWYGIADLEALAQETHKFEACYDDRLVGGVALRRVRSPIHAVDRIRCPVLLFQGLDDRVVSPRQAETMVAALRAAGAAVEYHAFAGEGHGFRRAETIRRCYEAELAFYRRVLGL